MLHHMKALLIYVCLVLVSCASPAVKHTAYQEKIQQNTQQLADDARDLLAVTQQALQDIQHRTKDPELQHAIDTLTKSQSLLGAKIDDGEEFKNLTKEQLQQAINKMYEQDQELKNINEQLELKNQHVVDIMVTKEIQQAAVDKYVFWQRFKLYSTLTTILAVVIAALYYIPSSPVRAALTAMFAMLTGKKAADATTTASTSGQA